MNIYNCFYKKLMCVFFLTILLSQANAQNNCIDYLNFRTGKEFKILGAEYIPLEIAEVDDFSPENIETGFGNNSLLETNKLIDYISSFASEVMRSLLNREISTVVYPASGTDAVTGFKMFRNASLIVGIDSNPFIVTDALKVGFINKSKIRAGWDSYSDVQKIQGIKYQVVEIILTDLKKQFPGIVLESVNVIKMPSTRVEGENAISGEIVFREFIDGPLKRYVHLHIPLVMDSGFNDAGYSYVVDQLLEQRFDAVFSKASMEFFSPFKPRTKVRTILESFSENGTTRLRQVEDKKARLDLDAILESSIAYSIGVELIKRLKKHKGLFVSTDGSTSNQLNDDEYQLNGTNNFEYLVFEVGKQKNFPFKNQLKNMMFGYVNSSAIELILFR